MMAEISLGVIAIAAIAVAFVAINGFATHAFADKSSAQNGINTADTNVHDHTPSTPQGSGGLGGFQDQKFHSGLCTAGISTNAFQCP